MRETVPWSVSRPRHHVGLLLAVHVLLAALLELAAGTGLAYVAGFGAVRAALASPDWTWLAAVCGFLAVSCVGYYYAYRAIFTVCDGPRLSRAQLRAVTAVGFGGFLAYWGGKIDRLALEAAGANPAEARIRAGALAGLEQGALAIGGCATAIAVLAAGSGIPASFTVPWAVIPVPGFLVAFWAAKRYRQRFGKHPGWRGLAGTFLESVYLVRELVVRPRLWAWGWVGMALFWAADSCAVWAGLAAFGYEMNGAALFVGFATGMLFTRRTGPLAGAGVLTLVLSVTIWTCGAPLPVAVAGVFAYRVLAFWVPMPVSLVALPALRRLVACRIEGQPEDGLRGVQRGPHGMPQRG
ncbi:MAG TPA: hypothetical protein VH589_24710 [Trebonia sp.]